MIDVDLLAVEYDRGKAVALVEYKNENAPVQSSSHPSYQALLDLGRRASIPVFACRYASDFSVWRVTPLNDWASARIAEPTMMSEVEYVTFLYRLRGRELPDGIFGADGNIAVRKNP